MLEPQSLIRSSFESSIMGESALMESATGRVLWESGGSSSTLSASLGPKLSAAGFDHLSSTILSSILWLAVVGILAQWIARRLQDVSHPSTVVAGLLAIAHWLMQRVPIPPPLVLWPAMLLYLLESYTCSTRRFLANSMSPEQVESYMEQLREEHPHIGWKVRCFHYETPPWIKAMRRSEALRYKRVTHAAASSYSISSCTDQTTAGIWKRALVRGHGIAAFSKIVLRQLVLLDPPAKDDYLRQQGAFVLAEGQGDESAEFSTSIVVPGFRSRLLAVRALPGRIRWFRLHLFWVFTLLGLTVPYRMWFADHCDEVRVTVVKRLSVDPGPTKSWFARKTVETTPDENDETFRSIMQQLGLYQRGDESSNATLPNVDSVESNEALMSEAVSLSDQANTTNVTFSSPVRATSAEQLDLVKRALMEELGTVEEQSPENLTKTEEEQ